MKEGLRLSAVVTSRLPRIAPQEQLEVNEWQIPAGVRCVWYKLILSLLTVKTPVSMSSHFILRDDQIFPEPLKFVPERWMGSPEKTKELGQYLVPFSRGSQSCLGQKCVISAVAAGLN